ncbi:Uncharacterized protein Adt_31246 [Abeliophyllum distichum]|uniref:CCHC-type domain-containing protein n=1 Tax=Abeliophyllum distichum TaxID=126358 RepID=A0ABD1RDL0_9LAMI
MNFRQGLEKHYETSKDLGLLNVLLAFEDNELDKIVSLVKGINLETGETVLVAKSEGHTPDSFEPIEQDIDSDTSEDDVIIHERFFVGIEPMEGVEPTGTIIPKPGFQVYPDIPTRSRNPIGDGKRPIGDHNLRPFPNEENDSGSYFTPKRTTTNTVILDLNCVLDPEKIIEDWYSNILMAMIINKEIIRSEAHSWSYVLATTRGNVRAYLEGITDQVKNEIWNDSHPNISNFVKRIVDQVYKQFTGQTYEAFKSERSLIHISDALNHLEKISICDMCYFENYCCEYSKYFYICPRDDWKNLVEKFIKKLPAPFNHDVLNIFYEAIRKQIQVNDPRICAAPDTSLGLAINLTRDILAKKCKENIMVRDSTRAVGKNPKLCCDKYKDQIPSQYGCFPTQKKRQPRKYKKKTYRFRKYKKPYKKKFFRKKKFFKKKPEDSKGKTDKSKKDKKKFCPKNKKNCRCWLCNETEHYANECPARIQNEDRVKLLQTFDRYGFHPVEDPSDTESLYYLETNSDSGITSESSSDNEW